MMPRTSFALASVIALSVWLGAALLVSAVVAPAAFAVLPTRTLAGALVGRVLPVVFWSGLALGTALALSGRALGARMIVGAGVFGVACGIAQLIVAPRIEAVRASIGGPVEALATDDQRRQLFGMLHGMSVLCLGVAGVAALFTLYVLVRNVGDPRTM